MKTATNLFYELSEEYFIAGLDPHLDVTRIMTRPKPDTPIQLSPAAFSGSVGIFRFGREGNL